MLYESILDTIGNTPLVQPPQLQPEARRERLRQARGPEPDGQRQGPHRAVHDPRRRGERRADARQDDPRADQRQHRHQPGDGLPGQGLPAHLRAAGQRHAGARGAAHGVRRRGGLREERHAAPTTPSSRRSRWWPRTPNRYYMPYQYGNENNPRAHYETTGPEILRDLPESTSSWPASVRAAR